MSEITECSTFTVLFSKSPYSAFINLRIDPAPSCFLYPYSRRGVRFPNNGKEVKNRIVKPDPDIPIHIITKDLRGWLNPDQSFDLPNQCWQWGHRILWPSLSFLFCPLLWCVWHDLGCKQRASHFSMKLGLHQGDQNCFFSNFANFPQILLKIPTICWPKIIWGWNFKTVPYFLFNY